MINRAEKWPGTSRLLSLPSARNEHFLFAEMECVYQLITIFHLIVPFPKEIIVQYSQNSNWVCHCWEHNICNSSLPGVPCFFRQWTEAHKGELEIDVSAPGPHRLALCFVLILSDLLGVMQMVSLARNLGGACRNLDVCMGCALSV